MVVTVVRPGFRAEANLPGYDSGDGAQVVAIAASDAGFESDGCGPLLLARLHSDGCGRFRGVDSFTMGIAPRSSPGIGWPERCLTGRAIEVRDKATPGKAQRDDLGQGMGSG